MSVVSMGRVKRGLGFCSCFWVAAFCIAPFLPIAATASELKDNGPTMSPGVSVVAHDASVFKADPVYTDKAYDAKRQLDIYGGKTAIDEPRPLLDLGEKFYTKGPLNPSKNIVGELNRVSPSLQVYGDWRNVVAYNENGGNEIAQVATRLNLDIDFRLTATERIHAFIRPLDDGADFTRCEFAGADADKGCEIVLDGNLETLFFEGDLARIRDGFTNEYSKLDLPFTFGLMPMFFQNGVWVEDAFTGLAFAIPAKNSPALDISNMDFTFFAGFDEVSTAAVKKVEGGLDNHEARVYGAAAFIEAMGGYWELGYGYLDADGLLGSLDYHNVTAAFTRRYGGWLSNSVRVIGNFGQSPNSGARTANGAILLMENSLITSKPLTLVPYLNAWVGIDKPQSLARAGGAGGVLKNTGLNFETDGVTNFPKLDDTGQDTFGAALGIEYLFNLDQQIVVEFAALQTIGSDAKAKGDQYGFGVRYQLPLSLDWILRADAMYGIRDNEADIAGVRIELRQKF